MPHATETAVNGDKSSSQFITRLTSFPAVNDSIETFKSNPYGRKSLEIIDGAYTRFAKPVEPYLETPYNYAKPYAKKADELADSGLSHVEKQFPIVKEDTHTIVDTAKSYAFWPLHYLTNTWQDEYSKTAKHNGRGPGISTSVIAIVSTELRIAADFIHAVADFIGPKYDSTKKQIEDTASHYKQIGQEKLGQAQKVGNEKASDAQKAGHDAKEQAKDGANKVSHEAHKAKDEAHKKATK